MIRITLLLTVLAGWLLPAIWSGTAAAAPDRRWVLPLEGSPVIRRGFDPPSQRWLAGHRGVDLAGRVGQSVRAAGPGTVAFAGVLAGRGVVTVRHGPLRTTYEPVTAAVAVGAQVTAGRVIGRLAPGHGVPRPGETALHWGLRRGDSYLDPMRLLRPGPVRLLPRWRGGGVPAVHAGGAGPPARTLAAPDQQAPSRPRDDSGRPYAGAAVVSGLAAMAGMAAVGRHRR